MCIKFPTQSLAMQFSYYTHSRIMSCMKLSSKLPKGQQKTRDRKMKLHTQIETQTHRLLRVILNNELTLELAEDNRSNKITVCIIKSCVLMVVRFPFLLFPLDYIISYPSELSIEVNKQHLLRKWPKLQPWPDTSWSIWLALTIE